MRRRPTGLHPRRSRNRNPAPPPSARITPTSHTPRTWCAARCFRRSPPPRWWHLASWRRHTLPEAGDLDTSWGNGGIATTAFPPRGSRRHGTASCGQTARSSLSELSATGDFSTFAIARFTTEMAIWIDVLRRRNDPGRVHAGACKRPQRRHRFPGSTAHRGGHLPALELDGPDTRLALVRLLPNRVPDPAFGDLGKRPGENQLRPQG